MANTAIPLTNKQVIQVAKEKRKVRVLIERPPEVGGTAYDEPMLFSARPTTDGNGYLVTVSLQGIMSWVISDNEKRFLQTDRGYTFTAYFI
jgi:hypothetical protein